MRSRIIIATVCLMLVGVVLMTLQCSPGQSQPLVQDQLTKFSSYEELEDFVKASTEIHPYPEGLWRDIATIGGWGAALMAESADSAPGLDYSTTNIQVEGVDEADIIKTDGEYLTSFQRIGLSS